MFDVLGPGTILGYCTNVHPGGTLGELKNSLDTHATRVRRLVCPSGDLPLGLWVPAGIFRGPGGAGGVAAALGPWLEERGLRPFSLNGFPYGDFQIGRVKRSVYQPDWRSPERAAFTMNLCLLLSLLILEHGTEGSISTLPLGWGDDLAGSDARGAADRLVVFAASASVFSAPRIHLDIEAEPGCALSSAADVVRFFSSVVDEHTRAHGIDLRQTLRACHDVCHSAVVFEGQESALRSYSAAEIGVGKVQISSALRVRFDRLSPGERREAKRQLMPFAEDRFLHQTMIRDDSGALTSYEDLPLALTAAGEEPRGEWRIHYHVPVFLDRIGLLETTSDEIPAAIRIARALHDVKHFEIETYAWPVLPSGVWDGTIEEGIAKELLWVRENAPKWLAGEDQA